MSAANVRIVDAHGFRTYRQTYIQTLGMLTSAERMAVLQICAAGRPSLPRQADLTVSLPPNIVD